jgi:hypothetical protein
MSTSRASASPVCEVVEASPVCEVVEASPVCEVVEASPVCEVVEASPVCEVLEASPVCEVLEASPVCEVLEVTVPLHVLVLRPPPVDAPPRRWPPAAGRSVTPSEALRSAPFWLLSIAAETSALASSDMFEPGGVALDRRP